MAKRKPAFTIELKDVNWTYYWRALQAEVERRGGNPRIVTLTESTHLQMLYGSVGAAADYFAPRSSQT